MPLPPPVLAAISAPGGGKVTLVIGAGCSFEAPTSIPIAKTCSEECHAQLVDNGLLVPGDCADPSDLSKLADAVFLKTGNQAALVEQLSQRYNLKGAQPNEGHLLAAALLAEGVVASVVTLNFDLALSTAIAQLGVADSIGIIDGPHDLPHQRAINLFYLHRNANAQDPEKWILRTHAMDSEWQSTWQAVVAAKVLAAPVVIFVGLGSPAAVLIETGKRIQVSIPEGNKAFQVDPGPSDESTFFAALGLDSAHYVPATWGEFMAELCQRVVDEQARQLEAAATAFAVREQLIQEDLSPQVQRLRAIGLLGVGTLRANWLLQDRQYCPDQGPLREFVADLLLALGQIARVTNAEVTLAGDGTVHFTREGRTIATCAIASGRGTMGRAAVEANLQQRRRRYRSSATPPTLAIVGATRNAAAAATPPSSVLLGDTSDSILLGTSDLKIVYVEALRETPALCHEVAP